MKYLLVVENLFNQKLPCEVYQVKPIINENAKAEAT